MRFIRRSGQAPTGPGAYVLVVRIAAPLLAKAGRREALLAPGRYLYCGSAYAPGGLRARLARHTREGKKAHWHIDQLTGAGVVEGAFVEPDGNECALAQRLSNLPIPLDGFGASDCRLCRSHLLFLPHGAALPSTMEHARKGRIRPGA